jgi:hypothetical protein
MKQKKSDTDITLTVTIHTDDTQTIRVNGNIVSVNPLNTLWTDLESALRSGLMDHGIIDHTGIGDWEV